MNIRPTLYAAAVYGSYGEPDQNNVRDALTFLFENQEKSKNHPEIQRRIEFLKVIDLAAIGMEESDWKTFRTVSKVFPQLIQIGKEVPVVPVTINGEEFLSISKNFVHQNELFCDLSDLSSMAIDGISPNDFSLQFYTFLTTGKIPCLSIESGSRLLGLARQDLTTSNREEMIEFALKQKRCEMAEKVLPLLRGARQIGSIPFREKITELAIDKELIKEAPLTLLAAGIEEKNEQIINYCLEYFWWRGSSIEDLERLKEEKLYSEILELIKILRLGGFSGSVNNADVNAHVFKIRPSSKLEQSELVEYLEAIEALCCFTTVELEVAKPTQDMLDIIFERLPHLQGLRIRDCEIETLRLTQLKFFGGYNCPNLKQVSGNMGELHFINCPQLSTIDGEQVKKCFIDNCSSLIKLSLPVVKQIICFDCSQLKDFICPEIKVLYVNDCEILEVIDLPSLETLSISNCTAIKELNLPLLNRFTCMGSLAIDSLNLHSPLFVRLENNQTLTHLLAARAKELTIRDCKLLTSVTAPRTPFIFLHRTDMLSDLDISQVAKLVILYCPQLTRLDLPVTEALSVEACRSLESVNAPLAKKIRVASCSNLKELKIGHAEWLSISKCAIAVYQIPANCKKVGYTEITNVRSF